MNRQVKKWFVIMMVLFTGLIIILNISAPKATSKTVPPLEITGSVTDQKAAQSCFDLLKKNLDAASNKDITAYIETLVSNAKEETSIEMTAFFQEYTLKHTLLSFEVLKQEENSMLVVAQQQTINLGKNNYRDHVTQAHHTFVKEGNTWKIQQTIMTNTDFID